VALDFDALVAAGIRKNAAVLELKKRPGWYDPEVLTALETVVWLEARYLVQEVMHHQLADGMILDQDVETLTDTLLVTKGQEVTPIMRKRLKNFAETVGLKEPLRVLVPYRQ